MYNRRQPPPRPPYTPWRWGTPWPGWGGTFLPPIPSPPVRPLPPWPVPLTAWWPGSSTTRRALGDDTWSTLLPDVSVPTELSTVPGWMWWAVGAGLLFLVMRTPPRRSRRRWRRPRLRSPFVLA